MQTVTAEEVAKHSTEDNLWVVVDSYVVDITDFVKDHPGGVSKILSLKKTSSSSFSFSSHFNFTSKTFKDACKLYDKGGSPVSVVFDRSRANGGLLSSGEVSSSSVEGRAIGTVTIVGKYVQV
jgi:hypothetical protein